MTDTVPMPAPCGSKSEEIDSNMANGNPARAAARISKARASTARASAAVQRHTEKTITPVVCTGGTWEPICSLASVHTRSSAR